MNRAVRIQLLRYTVFLVLLMLTAVLWQPFSAKAQEQDKIVRVGWYESPFNTTDELGRRSGYAYNYQQKLAAYTGWTYEYVEGSWSDLLQMLKEGKIDLMSDVSYTEERAESILYSSLPMGAEQYYLYVSPDNTEISPEDFSTFNGKKIGVNKGSVQIGMFLSWAQANGVQAELVELTGTENGNVAMMDRGEIDMYLSLDGFFDNEQAVPVCKIGSSDFYFAVNKARTDLLVELNHAMNRIQDEDPYYQQSLYSKYLQGSGINHYLSAEEEDWLSSHGPVRVGYQDNYLAFCAQDPKTGELTGALRDYLDYASSCLENATVDFETVCFPTAEEALEAMQRGEVDCVFPANFTDYDGEVRGVFMTPALMRTDMSAIVREKDRRDFSKKDHVTVAVNEGNPNYDMFLLDHFPDWRSIYFKTTPECLKAVADGQADCILISHYRYNNIAGLCEKYHLTPISTGVEMDYCIAVERKDTVLYSILTKITGAVPASTVNASLTYYFTEEAGYGFLDFLRENIILVLIVFGVIIVLLAVLLIGAQRKIHTERKKHLVPQKEDYILFDDLPVSYSVYQVIHAEYSETYDAKIVYVNHRFEEYGGLPANAIIGHNVRELFPHIQEDWYQNVKRAAEDGETVKNEYLDPQSGRYFYFEARSAGCPGYCTVTYLEV